jgi:hypothetical protein
VIGAVLTKYDAKLAGGAYGYGYGYGYGQAYGRTEQSENPPSIAADGERWPHLAQERA